MFLEKSTKRYRQAEKNTIAFNLFYIIKSFGLQKLIVFFIFIFGFYNNDVYAHPHTWFTSEFELIFREDRLIGMNVIWSFDKFFSSDIILGYDVNRDGVFNQAETDDVFANAFTYTGNYAYFTFVRVDSTRQSPDYIDRKNFSVSQKNGIVKYKFFVDLSKYNSREMYIACYDYTFYCDIGYTEKPIKIIGTSKPITYKIVENKNYPIYYDPFGSLDDLRVYYKWQKGLNTYYPIEIFIQF